jgi:hypothetical protein
MAQKELYMNRLAILAAIHIDDQSAAKSHMAFRFCDLYSMAPTGGDSHLMVPQPPPVGISNVNHSFYRQLAELEVLIENDAEIKDEEDVKGRRLIRSKMDRGKEVIFPDSEAGKQVQVVGLATGTWPSSSGGVSNCVRDLVDNLKSARWNVRCWFAHATLFPREFFLND